jgi:predicted metal-binding protein
MLEAEGRRALDDLRKFAIELGAEDGRIIATNKVVIEDRVVLKCKYWCDGYGANWSCPPFVPSPDEFRSVLKEYKYAMVAKFKCSAKVSEEILSLLMSREPLRTRGKELEDFYRIWDEDKRKAHRCLLKLEKFAFAKGFALALGLRPGSCNLCAQCNVEKPCVHPESLRFTPAAVGINLIKTLQNAGMSLSVPLRKVGESPRVVMMLLIT